MRANYLVTFQPDWLGDLQTIPCESYSEAIAEAKRIAEHPDNLDTTIWERRASAVATRQIDIIIEED